MLLHLTESAPREQGKQLLLRTILEGALQASGLQEIVYRDQRRHTYRDLGARVHRLASALSKRGVRPGNVVAMMDYDSHRYLEAYFGVPMMGAVLQTVNFRLTVEQIRYCLVDTGARFLCYNDDFREVVAKLGELIPELVAIRLSAPGEAGGAIDDADYETFLQSGDDTFEFPEFGEDTIATTFHTTGTTGNPKGVRFSHRQLVLHTLAMTTTLALQPDGQGMRRGDVYMPLTPMFHVHAWGLPYVATMMGVKQVYPGRYEPEMIVRLKQTERITFSHCVPTIVQMILAELTRSGERIDAWTMIIGGSALTATLQGLAAEQGITAVSGYGMSETGPVVSVARGEPAFEDGRLPMRAAGLPIPLVQTSVVDERMQSVPHNGVTPGELVLRAPWLTDGYLGQPQASEDLWRGGWMHTQDIATIDSGGMIVIRDRLKDIIKTGGEWVSSLELEHVMLEFPGVSHVAVIGVPDEKWGERPAAYVVAGDRTLTASVLRKHLEGAVAAGDLVRFGVPDRIFFIDALPTTTVGKIDKKLLRERFASDVDLAERSAKPDH